MLARFLSRLAIAIASVLIASVAMIGAVVFLFYAAFLFFEDYMSPPLAALLTTFVLLVFAMIVLMIGRGFAGSGRAPRHRRDEAADPASTAANAFASFFGAELGSMANKSPYLTIGAALALGVAFGISPRLRKIAAELLRR